MPRSYAHAALRRGTAEPALVRELQRDLRALGYLRQGINGNFGAETDAAVRRLQYDLLHNDGSSTRQDGNAPVAIRDYNRGRVTVETGIADPGFAACIEDLLADSQLPKLPSAADAAAANRRAYAAIAAAPSTIAPTPFLLAIFQQECNARHYAEPTSHDADNFVSIGLDFQAAAPNRVTSRGYGIGQYTLFHHPPRPEEVGGVIADPVQNVQRAYALVREKFHGELRGGTADTTADDLKAEHPALKALRLCRYQPADARYMRDCHACAMQVRKRDLTPTTPLYAGASQTYAPAPHYAATTYRGVPDRAEFLCDWPYAVRRYNGGGPDSYNSQARVLLKLLAAPPQTAVS